MHWNCVGCRIWMTARLTIFGALIAVDAVAQGMKTVHGYTYDTWEGNDP